MSSKRRLRRKRCERKTRFAEKEGALGAARHTRTATGSGPMSAYECPWCGGWHVGHMSRTMIREMAQRRAAR